ncbi:MAG: hypothetical protein ACYDH5_01605 [Acidimicrobiales bacterium]
MSGAITEPTVPGGAFSAAAIAQVRADVKASLASPGYLEAVGGRGYGHERLDQQVSELLLGAR